LTVKKNIVEILSELKELYIQMQKEKREQQQKNYNNKPSTFNNFKQRNYDFEDLEKKLLGWEDELQLE
jgi:DNA replication protein DnaD